MKEARKPCISVKKENFGVADKAEIIYSSTSLDETNPK
jgi:hypothetical protein